jgi:signal transduction histidine kinase
MDCLTAPAHAPRSSSRRVCGRNEGVAAGECLAAPHFQGAREMQRVLSAAPLALALIAGPALAESHASKDEAVAMVKKGVAFIKANGKDKGYNEISNKAGKFTDRDLYLVVYGLDGTVHAHGANEKMIGKNLIDLKDVDGKPFVKERVELAQSKGTFWQDYKFTNPVSKKIEPKQMYCEKLDDTAVCGGIYK